MTKKQETDLTALVAALHALMNNKPSGSLTPEEAAVLRHSRALKLRTRFYSFLEETDYRPWGMTVQACDHLWQGDES